MRQWLKMMILMRMKLPMNEEMKIYVWALGVFLMGALTGFLVCMGTYGTAP